MGVGGGGGAEGDKKGYVTIKSPRGGRRLVLVERGSRVLSATWRRNVGQVRPSEKSAFVQYCYSESCRI